MGQVSGSYPIYMSNISASLGGTNDLAWYRGRQYWNSGGAVVYISQNPAMSEFLGITNIPPYKLNATFVSQYEGGTSYGYSDPAYLGQAFGSLSPRTPSYGGTIQYVYTTTTDFMGGAWTEIDQTGAYGQSSFSALHIPNVVWLTSASAFWSESGGYVGWSWGGGAYWGAGTYNLRLE